MRIPSGVTDQYIYFVAVDDADFSTRETGLSSFTVYRSRNGGAAAAMTTPTINETDSSNMLGVYELLLDEDMTLDAGNDSEEMVFHITHAGMAPVTRTIELYRPKVTAGETLNVSSGIAGADVVSISGDSVAADNLEADYDGTGYNKSNSTIGTCTANTDMRGTNDALLASSAPANFADLAISAATGRVTVGTNADKTGYSISGTLNTLDDLDVAQEDQFSNLPANVRAEMDSNSVALAAILLDTAEIGAAGAGLSAIPWNSSWDAEVESEVADALTAYNAVSTSHLPANFSQLVIELDAEVEEGGRYGVFVATVGQDAYDDVYAAGVDAIFDEREDSVAAVLTTQMTESYAADGAAPTLTQALMLMQQKLNEFSIAGSTQTVRGLNGVTPVATFDLGDLTGSSRST